MHTIPYHTPFLIFGGSFVVYRACPALILAAFKKDSPSDSTSKHAYSAGKSRGFLGRRQSIPVIHTAPHRALMERQLSRMTFTLACFSRLLLFKASKPQTQSLVFRLLGHRQNIMRCLSPPGVPVEWIGLVGTDKDYKDANNACPTCIPWIRRKFAPSSAGLRYALFGNSLPSGCAR